MTSPGEGKAATKPRKEHKTAKAKKPCRESMGKRLGLVQIGVEPMHNKVDVPDACSSE
jgi:hypothetical protein